MNPTIAILTALPKEHGAVKRLMIEQAPHQAPSDPTLYILGYLDGQGGNHPVVLACLTKYANNPAAITATNVLRSFPSVEEIIFVGIAAGIPRPDRPEAHVRLGDVIVSSGAGVIQFDLGVATPAGFEVRNSSPPPSARLLQAVNLLESELLTGHFSWHEHLSASLKLAGVTRPRQEPKKNFKHSKDQNRKFGVPRIFRGKIGASNSLMKDPEKRDKIAQSLGLLAIEMEGSGVADASWEGRVGYLVIRGACDYGDQWKDDSWQIYAAHVAAAYLSALLHQLPSRRLPSGGRSVAISRQQDVVRRLKPGELPERSVVKSIVVSKNRLTCCIWNSKGETIYVGGFDGILYASQLSGEFKPVAVVGISIIRTVYLDSVWSFAVVGNDAGRLVTVDLERGMTYEVGSTGSSIYSIAGCGSANRLLIGSRDGIVSEWNIDRHNGMPGSSPFFRISRLRIVHEHHGAAFAVRYDALHDRYVSVGADGMMYSSDLRTGQLKKLKLTDGTLFSLSLGINQSLVACGDHRGNVWVIKDEDTPRLLQGHADTVRSIQISPAGNWLATGSKDGTVRLWHMGSGRVWILLQKLDYIYEISFSVDGSQLAIADGTGAISWLDFGKSIDHLQTDEVEAFCKA